MNSGATKPVQKAVPDWGAERLPHGTTVLWVSLAGYVAIATLAAAGVARFLTGEWSWMVPLAVAIGTLIVGAARILRRGRSALNSFGARLLTEDEAPRFTNIVQGLADDLSVDRPNVWVTEEGGPNAFVAWARGPQLGVTRSLLNDLSRTESEAVAAFCMTRLLSGEARRTTYLLGSEIRKPDLVGAAVDAAAVALTRYPPALIAVLEKAAPVEGRDAALWMVGSPKTHDPLADRVSFLADL